MPRPDPTPIQTDERGQEHHESFGLAGFSRVQSTPGVRLFDSTIPHGHYITLSIKRAKRERQLHRDWIFGQEELIEVSMSEAQFGALVSSFNMGDGVPVTISRFHDAPEVLVPEPLDETPRLQLTAKEVRSKTAEATADVTDAVGAVRDAFDRKAGRREMAEVLGRLENVLDNLPSNMKFAADSLSEHTEKVVTKAAFDIEAAVMRAGERAGLDSGEIVQTLGLGSGEVVDAEPEIIESPEWSDECSPCYSDVHGKCTGCRCDVCGGTAKVDELKAMDPQPASREITTGSRLTIYGDPDSAVFDVWCSECPWESTDHDTEGEAERVGEDHLCIEAP